MWADELSTASAQTTVVAPGGLVQKEQTALQRQYQYQVRQKDLLIASHLFGTSNAADISLGRAQAEEEKLHRYFGIAVNLCKNERLEEAAEILQYILTKDPEDNYTKEYLARVQKAIERQKRQFRIENKIEASKIKKNKLENLVKDGVAYYDSKNFDKALLKFADALALDPNDPRAGRYMDELKKYYSKEVEVENIVRNWEGGSPNGVKKAAEKLLDDKKDSYDLLDKKAATLLEGIEKDADQTIAKSAEKLLDDKKMKGLLLEKRAASLLNNTELGDKVRGIIDSKGIEEQKSMQFNLGPGDAVQINVRDHPELSGKTTVQLSGDIILPLVNDTVMARGLTADELTEKVAEILKRYVQDPVVSVSIVEYKSKMFYVIDEVSCTPFPITRSYLTLRDALFISDWGDNRALGRVLVIKPSKRHPIIKRVDAFDLIFRGNLENDVRIEDGDVIYVPLTIVAKATKTIYDTTAPFRALRNARDEYLNSKWNQKDWRRIAAVPQIYEQEAKDAQNLSIANNSVTTLVTRT